MMSGPQEMPAEPEEIVNDAVDGCEALKLLGRLEAPHPAFAFSGRLVEDFGAMLVSKSYRRWRAGQ